MNGHYFERVLAIALGAALVSPAAGDVARAQMKAAGGDITAAKSLGTKSAPITMEVFSDFQCPACRQLYQETLRQVIDNYVATGKVYLVHHDFPLAMHKYARDAARWADAAALLGKYEKVEAVLYAKRETWEANGQIEPVVATVLTPAEMKKARQLTQNNQLDAAIEKDVALGNKFQVRQTPTSIVTHNGQTYPIVGVVSYAILRRFLDDLLRQ